MPGWTILAAALLLAALFVTGVLDDRTGALVSDLSFPVVGLATSAFIAAQARRREGRDRLATVVFAVAFGLYAVGSATFSWYELTGRELSYPSPFDLLWLQFGPMAFAGMFLWTPVPMGRYERIRATLDGLVGSVAAITMLDVFYLSPALEGLRFFADAASLVTSAYVAVDAVLVVALMSVAVRLGRDPRLVWLSGIVIAFMVADIGYSVAVTSGTYVSGHWYDAGWMLAHAFAVLAFRLPPAAGADPDRPELPNLWMFAPYAAVAVLFAVEVATIGRATGNTVVEGGFIVTTGLIIVRQAVSIRTQGEVVERQRNDLVSSISHELRTPLTAVVGYTELLAGWRDLDDELRDEMLATVGNQAVHVSGIVEDLVALARGRLESATLRRETGSASTLVADAVAMVVGGVRSEARVRVRADAVFEGDIQRLRQVLVNLISNATKYGGTEIEVVARRTGPATLFEVHDDGPGVPRRYEADIWRRFDRGPHRLNGSVPGSGIGLSVVAALVRAHGGTFGYRRSAELGGSCFWFRIPDSPADLRTGADGPTRSGGQGAGRAERRDPHRPDRADARTGPPPSDGDTLLGGVPT